MDKGSRTTIGWASGALLLTAAVAIVAKITGVILAPGVRGVLGSNAVNSVEVAAGTFAYALMGLLVALVCGASFELARARGIHTLSRGGVVATSGLIVALVSPAVVDRLNVFPLLALSVITGLVALIAGLVVVRTPRTRAIGVILVFMTFGGFFRIVSWETSSIAFERSSSSIHELSRGFSTAAVTFQALSVFVAATWIGTRSRWRGRVLANVAIVLAFVLTWLAARTSSSPSSIEAVLRASLSTVGRLPAPFLLGSISAFIVPASIFLAMAALAQRGQAPAITASLIFALLSNGAFDVPLHALLVTVSAQWAMLAMADDRGLWGASLAEQNLTRVESPSGST